MIRAARRRPDPADDTGATLVFALILITVVAVAIGALLSFGDSSVRVTVALRSQAGDIYGSDGAAQAAITALRRSPFNNDTASATYPQCFGNTDPVGTGGQTLQLNNFYPSTTGGAASSAAVTCTADPNTGAAGGLVVINPDNKPGNAILTTGQRPGEDGLNIKALNNSLPFLVHGSVVSNSTIRVTNGSLKSNVAVYAHTGCSGTIVSTPPPDCAAGTLAIPDYSSEAAGVVPTYRTVPASTAANCPGKVMTFLPGYYDDAQALSSLMDGNGTCKDSVWWFTPGTYYFDFHNTSNPLLSGSDVWTIKNGQLIGGTPVDSNGVPLPGRPANPSTVPGACQNPIRDDTEGKGVQFIFGGDSQLQVTGTADVELCANYHLHDKMIAVYGVRSGDDPATPPTATTKPATVTSADAVYAGTVTASNLANVDSVGATWTKATATPTQTGAFALGGYVPTTIPAGSVLKSATLRVMYKNTAGAAGDVRTVTFTPAGGTTITATLPATSGSGLQTASVNVFGGSTGALAAAVHSGTSTGASVSYSAKLAHIGTETVDAIQLDLGYLPPTFRGEGTTIPGGNCLTGTYTGGSAGQCAVLSTPTNYRGHFYIQGTTYAPNAVIDLTLNNITSQVLRFGVVARSLWVKETGSISYSGPVIEVPDNSTGYGPGGTVVYLSVYLCQAAPTCSAATGRLGLRARVLIYDPTTIPSPPARQITIQSWAVQR